jgi:hypothetical protein
VSTRMRPASSRHTSTKHCCSSSRSLTDTGEHRSGRTPRSAVDTGDWRQGGSRQFFTKFCLRRSNTDTHRQEVGEKDYS